MRPRASRNRPALLALLCLALAVTALACTGDSLRGTSTGWSPVAAVLISVETGGNLNEGASISALDDTLTVTNPRDFAPGQVLLIDREQVVITAIEDGNLIVERGANNTRARSHPDGAPIFTLGALSTVFIGTKEGEIKVLEDDGSGNPSLQWSYKPPE